MYKKVKPNKTSIKRNTSYEGERIEEKIHRIVNNKEPIKDGAPIIFTERKDGVRPEFDIRTDKMEIALDAMTAVAKTYIANRAERIGERAKAGMKAEAKTDKEVGGPESIQGTT